ncbi:MAG: protease Lon-related BREX system protein BrxL [Chloroflexi bacterium]|nr:protease Lon-related BREX system protein BrxL [Bacteroidota bacterium]MCL5110974.1 protease Lon-related BREX system protein BrxL [Chloroflexota bacterium]
MTIEAIALDGLDEKAAEAFPGLVVRKDLVRRLRSAYSVPIFVIEFLLGKYCAATDPLVIEQGLAFVHRNLSEKYVKPDESEAIKSRIQLRGSDQIIDKVSATLRETDDKYWARLHNALIDFVNVDQQLIEEHDRLLMGGVWAEVSLGYDPSLKFHNATRPFFIEKLKPIQLSTRGIGPVQEARAAFSRDEWIDLLIRSLGMEPNHEYFSPRRKLLYLTRLIPLVERNYNLIELGPRGTGKSFVYQQISPYCHLVSGGQTSVPQMFVNLASGQRGLVCLWDTVAFDEAAGVRFQDKNGISIMKNYMEDGTFSRGREIISAEGSIVFVGNLDGDIQTILRTSNLFYPLPKEMDTAFFDRIHAYLPGWELGKTRDEYYTSHFGFVSDYLAEILRHLRKTSYVDLPEKLFAFGSHVGGRDAKAVRKTVSGLVKLLHPNGDVTKGELAEYIELALELRRRVKEQLKKMGGLEYWDVNFSYVDRETSQQTFVPLPESGGGTVISGDPLPPGSVYTIGSDPSDRRLAIYLLQTQINPGSGRMIPLGSLSPVMKEALKAADAYLRAHIRDLGIDRDPKQYDFTVQAVNLNQAKEGAETAIAFFISMVSALLERPTDPTTVIMGEMSVKGMLQKVSNLPERLQMALEAGAKRILIPSENKRDLADVPDEVLNKLQPIFYTDPINAAIRAMGLQ